MGRMTDRIQKAEKGATLWQPKTPGDYIAGELLGIRQVENQYGTSTIIDVKIEDTTDVVSFFCPTVVQHALVQQGAKVGDAIGIKYLGEVKNYKDFVVLIDHKEEE